MNVNRSRLFFEILPTLLLLATIVFANIIVRKRSKLRDRSEWDRIFDAAQRSRQQDLLLSRPSPVGHPADSLDVRRQPNMTNVKFL
jgi:hypothetical protein